MMSISMNEWNTRVESSDPVVNAEVSRLLAWAGSIIDGVDRNRLGSFSFDEKVIVHYYAFAFGLIAGVGVSAERLNNFDEIPSEKLAFASEIEKYFNFIKNTLLTSKRSSASSPMSYFSAEAWLWHCVVNDIDFNSVQPGNQITGDAWVIFKMLSHVYENPTFLPFFEVGVWDDDLIARCLANGIDTSMALSLDGVVDD